VSQDIPPFILYSSDTLVFFVNLLGVRVFGELEFWFSSIKSVYRQMDLERSNN